MNHFIRPQHGSAQNQAEVTGTPVYQLLSRATVSMDVNFRFGKLR